jgi:nitrite reductase/ring-hydroxylating ferredoxin subunit
MSDAANTQEFSGYHQRLRGDHDLELAQTGPATVMGELLRRYWHPVAISCELGKHPKLVRILGEELVLFRDMSGQLGLVLKNCPHRRASLEYGRIAEHGIRCCYHGWHFDIDGTILDIPGQPASAATTRKVKQNCRLGAYPTHEFRGLIFAYMGPPEEQPIFPHFDAYDIEDMVMTPYSALFKCNWIQVLDAIVDPVHTAFLHQDQFTDGFGTVGEYQFYERDRIRFLGTATRRVGDNAWVRINELILPNFTQSGAAFSTDGTRTRFFGRSAFTRWVVPLDDTHCMAFAWGNFGERGDPLEYNNKEGMERMEQGEVIDRSYEEKLRSPGDVEAVEGMGAISDHSNEHLVAADRGVALYRRRLKKLCRDLAKGKSPPVQAGLNRGSIHTYGSDTVITAPAKPDSDDSVTLQQANDQVMDILFDGDRFDGEERDRYIIRALEKL